MKQRLIIFSLSFLLFGTVQAQTESSGSSKLMTEIMSDPNLVLLFFVCLALVVCVILLIGITVQLGTFYYKKLKDAGTSIPWPIGLFGIFMGDTSTLNGNPEDEVIEGHDYDGIVEYDNDLPPWWKYLFYLTIVFAFVYIFVFHVFNIAPLQLEEYTMAVEKAEIMYANVDLEYEKPSEDEALLKESETVFVQNCAACHGQLGEGGVGPNLTDKYWLHGGDINAVYHTIKYGIEEKGMKSWKNEFSNEQIYGMASYIATLQGTNPPNAKEPQGEPEAE